MINLLIQNLGDSFLGENAVLTGWGRIDAKDTISDILQVINIILLIRIIKKGLQEIELPITSESECNRVFSNYLNLNQTLSFPKVLCFGGNFNKSGCYGDSGSPLIVQKKGNKQLSDT